MLVKDLLAEVDALLSETPEAVRRRERAAFDEAAHPLGGALVLFGAGNLGRKTLRGLRRAGIEPLAFSDNDPRLWGTKVDGLEVRAPEDAAARHGKSAAFVLTIWRGEGKDRMPDRIAQVRALGCERVVPFAPLFWKYPDAFLPHYLMDLPHKLVEQADAIRAAAALFTDAASLRELVAQLRLRLLGDFDSLPAPVAHEIYFPDDLFAIDPAEVFVDCGAFDGDTLRRLFARRDPFTGAIKAFEPDPKNFVRLQQYVAGLPEALRDRVEVFPYAVNAVRTKVRFDATGNEAAAVGFGDAEVQAERLDDVLQGASPTYLKMDVEGSEMAALQGAERILREHAPALAICVYHRQNHIWKVPLQIAAVGSEYSFFLRPHLLEGWDTVLYAVPRRRLRA